MKPAYEHHVGNCTFLGQTGPTAFFPRVNAVDHYLWRCGDAELLLQRGSSQHHAQFACLVHLADRIKWQESLSLLQQHEEQNSLAFAVA